jgi:hypothetical protein
LKKVKHLDRLAITAAPPVIRGLPLLRLGYPAPGRKNLLFDCSGQSLRAPVLLGAYKPETLSGQTYRLVRDSTITVSAPWPDTLLIRLYDEVADEEIALERGDLDAAIFWPGEASTHIRDAMRWQGRPSGRPVRSLLAVSALGPSAPIDSTWLRANERVALTRLNQELFHGDLTLWPYGEIPPPSTVSARFEVSASIPGRDSIERFLNRALGSSTGPGSSRIVRLSFLDPPPESISSRPSFTVGFIVYCPVISAPRLLPYLDAIGPDSLVNLFDCGLPAHKP